MQKSCLLISFLLFINFSFSQNYSVSYFQKINEINSGFSGTLNNEDNFGVSITQIGDLDGNGVNDLAVGSYFDDDGGNNRGAVWILFLESDDSVLSHTKISSISGGFTGEINDGDRFGGAVSYLGDVNNDGLKELAVGADFDNDGGLMHGAVWILSLSTNGTVNSHVKISDIEGNFNGIINGSAIFGADIENIGDLNGDGVDDLAVGSNQDHDGGRDTGAVWILFMNTDLTVNSSQKISSVEGGFTGNLELGDFFGSSVANIGDLDGDGVVDIAVGCSRDDDLLINSGSVYILFLNTDGTVKSHSKISNLEGGLTHEITPNALFGESIAGVVDIDNDGKIEIIVGAMKQVNPTFFSLSTGAFFLIELNADGTVSEDRMYTYRENCFTAELEHDVLFGGSVSFLTKDPNNLKMAIGSYRDSENGYRKGAVYILTLGEISYSISSFEDPSDCGFNDGVITISGFPANTQHTISYNDGSDHLLTLVANANGDIILSGLTPGIYNDIIVDVDHTDCTFNLGQITLIATGINPVISLTVPTDCSSNNGSIIISGLLPNMQYTVSYNNGLTQTQTLTSNSSGVIVVTGLLSGFYRDIVLEEIGSGCIYNIGEITLTSTGLNAGITHVNPTDCSANDGIITISRLSVNLEYIVSYNNGSLQSVMLLSDAYGELVLSELSPGIYSDIIVQTSVTGCSGTVGDITLISTGFNASISSVNPSDCSSDDGSITIAGLSGNTEYTVSFDDGSVQTVSLTTNANGELSITGLKSGIYNQFTLVETSTGCSENLSPVELQCLVDDLKCIKVKKVFTPNDDGYNDSWSVEFISSQGCDYNLKIFDRYGKLLKTLTPQNNVWNGIYRGQQMPTSDYWFFVEYMYEGENRSYRSHFTLKR